ncbi:MAG: DUF1232 domain-containing protein [Alcanivoracaceae bacterium]|jgi:uncharacterized membrane protein YkvA (DUF1232 family)|nr:DUF1232 domain-containing protein [Alcanivoracaceae bacterium]
MSSGKAEHRAEVEAEQLLAEPQAAGAMAERAGQRANRQRGRLGEAFEDVMALTRLVRAWASGRYRAVPTSTILAAIGALVYFLMPLDALPDFIFALGLLDDIALIGKVVQMCRRDLQAFRIWEQGGQDNNTDSNNGTDNNN